MKQRPPLKAAIDDVSGDYQYCALHKGLVSQRLWHRKKIEIIGGCLQGKNYEDICDAGCGSGVVADFVSSLLPKSKVVGYDINERSLAFASRQFKKKNLDFCLKNLLKKGENDKKSFDFIYSLEVIEHFSFANVKEYLAALFHIGKDNARYFITTPDYLSMWPLIEWSMDTLKLTPKMAGHQHLTKFTKSRLRDTLERNGFDVLEIGNFCGMSPFFGHLSLKLSTYIDKIENVVGYGNIIFCEFRKKR